MIVAIEEIVGSDRVLGEQKVQTGFCRKIKFADKGANLERLGRYWEESLGYQPNRHHLDKSEQT